MIEKDLRELTQVSLEMLAVLESTEHAHDNDSLLLAHETYGQLEERAMSLIGYQWIKDWHKAPQLALTVSALVAAREAHQDACEFRASMEKSGTSPHSTDPDYLRVLSATYAQLAVLIDATARFIEMARKLRAERKEEGGAK